MKSDSDGVPDGDQPSGDGDDAQQESASAAGGDSESAGGTGADRAGGSRDAADSAALERELTGVGARPVAGSARAAARASAARSGTTPGKGRATAPRDGRGKRANIFVRVTHYLREVISELRKVIWPTKNEMTTYSIVVILFLIFMIAITWGADFGFARFVLAIFG